MNIESGRFVGESSILAEIVERIRDVSSGPDGYLYIPADSVARKLLRVVPDYSP